jgi:signal peptidase I
MLMRVFEHFIAPRLALLAAKLAASRRRLTAFQVLASNMEPTLGQGEVAWFTPRGAQDLTRGQLVVVTHHEYENALVPSRVVAFPGESVELRDGDLLINGTRIPEPYLKPGQDEQEHSRKAVVQVVPPNHVWLLGDFRDMSKDSRFLGAFPMSLVKGVICFAHPLGDHRSPRIVR